MLRDWEGSAVYVSAVFSFLGLHRDCGLSTDPSMSSAIPLVSMKLSSFLGLGQVNGVISRDEGRLATEDAREDMKD